jgi:hypothetical protein
MFRLKIIMIVGGIFLTAWGVQEWRLAQDAKETPQTITCADLSAKGPGDNANIVLTDSLFCADSIVYETKKRSQTWNKIWVPVVPRNGEYIKQIAELLEKNGGKINGPVPPPQNIKVILKSSKVPGQAELLALSDQTTVNGLVTNKIESLGSKERKHLEESYPGTDFTQCWIVDHDRKPYGLGQVAGLAGGGVLLSLVGVGMLFAGRSTTKS